MMTTPRRSPDQSVRSLLENAERRSRYEPRRGRWLVALVTCSAGLALAGGGVFLGQSLGWRLPFSRAEVGTTEPGPVAPAPRENQTGAAAAEKAPLVPPASPTDRVVRNVSLNFQFAIPAAPWQETKPDAIDPKAQLSMAREGPECIFTISAERPGTEARLDSEQAAELCKLDLEGTASPGGIGKTETVRVFGLKGARFECSHAKSDPPMISMHTVLAHNGYLYKLVTYGRQSDRSQIAVAADELAARFQLVDRFRTALARDDSFGVYESPRYAYRVDLKDTEWVHWSGFAVQCPDAEIAATGPGRSGFLAIPVYLMGATVDTGELLVAMALRASGITDSLASKQIKKEGEYEVITFPAELPSPNGELVFRFRLVRNRSYACLFSAWTRRHSVDGRRAIEDVLKRVTVRFPKTPIDAASFDQREQQRHGTVFNDLGVQCGKKNQHRQSVEYYRIASALLPNDPVVATNLGWALWGAGDLHEALAVFDKNIPRFPQHHRLRLHQARVLVDLGRLNDAKEAFARLFQSGYENDDDFHDFLGILGKTADFERGVKEAAAYMRRSASPKIVGDYGMMLVLAGRSAEAVEYLSRYLKTKPWNDQVGIALVTALRTAGRSQEALPVIDRLIKEGARLADAYRFKGYTEFDLQRYEEAKASFATALKYDPDNTELRQAFDITTSILGQGDNRPIMKPLDPVELPAAVATGKRLEAASVRGAGYGAYYELLLDAVEFAPHKLHRRSHRMVVHLLDPSSVAQFNLLQVSFYPKDEELFVERLEVFDAEGKKAGAADENSYYVTDAGGTEATDRKVLNLPVPGLAAGRRIELCYTIRSLRPPARLPLCRGCMAQALPVGKTALALRAAPESLATHQVLAPPAKRIGDLQVWSVESLFPPANEVYADPDHPLAPVVLVADNADTWKEIARGYLTLVADRLQPDPEIPKLAHSLVRNEATDDEKVLALARYVQREYSYLAIEFGQRGLVMNPPAQIVRERFGDCKDHAALLFHLLRAVNVPAHLALVNATGPVYPEVPSLGQFNHLVVYLPNWRGGRYLDGTDKHYDPDLPFPPGLAHQSALILDPENPRFVRAPDYGPDAFQLDVERELRPEGPDLLVREALKVSKYYAAAVRQVYGRRGVGERSELLRLGLLSIGTNPGALTVEAENLQDSQGPVILRNSYRVANVFHEVEGKWVGRLPLGWEAASFLLEDSTWRIAPVKMLGCSTQVKTRLTVPEGYTMTEVPEEAEDGVYFSLRRSTRAAPGAVDLTWTLRRVAGRFPAHQYAELRAAYRRVREALMPTITFRRP